MKSLGVLIAILLTTACVLETSQAAQSGGKPKNGGGDRGSGLRVVDTNDQFVGFPIQMNSDGGFTVLRKIPALGSKPLVLNVDSNGFVDNPRVQFLYTSNNCTGDRYVQGWFGHDLPDPIMYNHDAGTGVSMVVAGQLVIAAAPFQRISISSQNVVDLMTNHASDCLDWSPGNLMDVGILDFVNLYSTLGVQAPFRVE
jgi:hypothetical protein